ncbi:MAG TPA: hypothetical protein IGS17_10245 [Oscillatoriales cyanobacterium M59_W2019_021]|nr:hypothetical protein [Oscillatoriales cyanobacterium M4454_W2019_049]HIK51285.1 hypothetical protein [Oscillatoriales cyanobacterium M59_W2019_021]
MKKLNLFAVVGWSIVAASVYAQEPPAEMTRDRFCQEIQTGMSVQDVLGLAAAAELDLVPSIGNDDRTVFLEWSDAETSEEFSASFLDNSLANFSCSMVVSSPTSEAAEPTTCDRLTMGMSASALQTLMAEAGFTALPRPVGGSESIQEWSNSQTAEFIRTIFSNGQLVSLSCSTEANDFEVEPDAIEELLNPENSVDFGEELPEN